MVINALNDENELLRNIAAGNQSAFRVIYDRFRKKIYTFSLKMLKSELLAEEVVQEAFLKVWQLGDDITKITHLEAYLVILARNRSLDMLRRLELENKVERATAHNWQEGHNETEEQILLNDTRQILLAGIECLPPQQKLVYQLCHQEGLKYEEAAQRLNLSPLTVKKHMQLALQFLRNYIAKHTDIAVAVIILRLFS